jgi:hypothetical protein
MEKKTLFLFGAIAIAVAAYFKIQSDRLQRLELEHERELNQIEALKKSVEKDQHTQAQTASDALATEVDSLHRLQESYKVQQDALEALQKERESLLQNSGHTLDEAKSVLKIKNDLVRDLESKLKSNRTLQSQINDHTKLVYANETLDKKERHNQRKVQIEWHVQNIRNINGQIAALARQKYTYDRQNQIDAMKDQVKHLQVELNQLHQDEAQDNDSFAYQKATYDNQFHNDLGQLKTEEADLVKQLQQARADRDGVDHALHDTDANRKDRIQQINLKSTNIKALLQDLRTQIDVQLARCVQMGYKVE